MALYLRFETLLEDEIWNTASSDTNKYCLKIMSSLNCFVKYRASSYAGEGDVDISSAEHNLKLKLVC